MTERVGSMSALSISALVIPSMCSTVIVTMKVADALGASRFAGVVSVSVVAFAVLSTAALRGARCWSGRAHLSWGDLLVVATVAACAVGVWVRGLQRNLSIPVIYGVDPARHVSMTAWIAEHQRLVHGVAPQLEGLSNYPPGGHTLAAMLSWGTGLPPLGSTWLVMVVSVLVIVALVAVMAVEVTPGRPPLAGVVAVCLSLTAWRFTVGMATYEFYFSQSVGLALSLGGVLTVVCGVRAHLSWWRWAPLAAVAAISSFVTYPQQALVVPAAMGVGVWSWWRRDRAGFSAQAVLVAAGVTAATAGAGVLVLRRAGYLSSGAFYGNGEGAVTTLRLDRVGGWVAYLLVLWGLLATVRWARWRIPGAAVVLVAFAMPVGLAVGLWMLQHGIILRAPVTQYRIVKNVFTAVPFAAVLAGIGVGSIPQPAWVRSPRLAWGAALVTIMVPLQPRLMGTTRSPIVSSDSYALARWTADHYDVADVGLAGPELEPFTLWIVGLRRTLDPDPAVVLLPFSTQWADWPLGPNSEHYLLVSGDRLVARYLARPGVELVRRHGSAVLLHREG